MIVLNINRNPDKAKQGGWTINKQEGIPLFGFIRNRGSNLWNHGRVDTWESGLETWNLDYLLAKKFEEANKKKRRV